MAEPQRIATNLRTIRILEAIAKEGRPLTPTEINRHLSLPKQSIHRLCHALETEGLLSAMDGTRRLQPTERLVTLATRLAKAADVDILRHQILQSVARQIRETVNFACPERQGMTYRDRVETDWPLRIQLPIGSHVPFHCTASGKTYLANLTKARRRTLLDSLCLTRHARNTITSRATLDTALTRIRRQGFAIDDEEFMDGMVALSVPVLDHDKRYLASLAFHAPTQRFGADSLLTQLDVLRQGARELSTLLAPGTEHNKE